MTAFYTEADYESSIIELFQGIDNYGIYDKQRLRKFVENHFSMDVMVDEHLTLYKSIYEKR